MGQKMTNIAKPIIKQIKDNREALDFFEKVSLPAEDEPPRRMYFIIMSDFMRNPVVKVVKEQLLIHHQCMVL